ncbi:MAG: hypothetical protein AB7E80_03235 [Hyphomicrobiaceae bacterium]
MHNAIAVFMQLIKVAVFFATLALPHAGSAGLMAHEDGIPPAHVASEDRPLSNPRRR